MSNGNMKISLCGGLLHLIDELRTFGALAESQPAIRGLSKKTPRTPQEWAHTFIKFLEERHGRAS